MAIGKPKVGKKTGAGIGAALLIILGAVFANEGGYVNDPADPGGATNHGITQEVARKHGYTGDMRDFPKHCAVEVDAETGTINIADLRDPMPEVWPCADSILVHDYIAKPGFMPLVEIDPAVAEEVIDTAVNMGPARPSRWFQASVNATCNTTLQVDGRIGPMTVKAWGDCRVNLGPRVCVAMLHRLDGYQEAEYDRLVRVNPRLKRFRRGWQNYRIGNVDPAQCWREGA